MVVRAATAVKPKSKAASSPTVTSEAGVKPAPKTRRRTKVETRTRIYWAVFNQHLKRVAVFEFDQKVEAEKRAEKLSKSSGEGHFIQKIKANVPAQA